MAEKYYKKKAGEGKAQSRHILYAFLFLLSLGFVFLLFFSLISLGTGGPIMGECVAVVEVNGPLTTEDIPASLFADGMAGSYRVAQKIEALNERDDVGAVLFVINSPGGSVVATNEIYRAVDSLEKPKVSYFREVAASGGYYIATPSNYIISEPNALTGSIGVIATFLEMEELLSNIGVSEVVIKSGAMKDMGNPFRNMTEEERALMDEVVAEIFKEFMGVIIEQRGNKLNMPLFNGVTDGRVLTGRMAYDAGLVDQLGTRDDALAKAAELGGMEFETVDDIPVCKVDVSVKQAGLFDMKSLFGLPESQGSVKLQYR